MLINRQIKTHDIKTKDLTFQLLNSGDIHQIKHNDENINMYKATSLDGSVSNIYLRINKKNGYTYTKLIGVDSPSTFAINNNQIFYKGNFENISYLVTLTILDNKWFYDVDLKCDEQVDVSVFIGQDVSLNWHRSNEAYTCQYLDHKIFENESGYHVLTKQNQGKPYLLEQGSLTKNCGFSTDGFQFFGLDYKFNYIPKAMIEGKLENKNYQYEFAYISFMANPIFENNQAKVTFYAYLDVNYKDFPTGILKLDEINAEYRKIESVDVTNLEFKKVERKININNVYTSPSFSEAEINQFFKKRHLEEKIDGKLVSFFAEDGEHVVLQDKEHYTERTHGSIIINNGCKIVEQSPLASTNFILGIFNSHVVVGHANIHKFSSDLKNPLNVAKVSGERILVKIDGEYRLLGLPAVYSMTPSSSCWYYKIKDDILKIEVAVKYDLPLLSLEMTSLNNVKYDIIIFEHIAMGENEFNNKIIMERDGNTFTFKGDENNFMHTKYPNLKYKAIYEVTDFTFGNDEIFFVNEESQYPLITCQFNNITTFRKDFYGLINGEEYENKLYSITSMKEEYITNFKQNINHFYAKLANNESVEKFNNIFIWFTHNALIHYAAPHGLEQYGGGGWGTRDVCQGPIELFIALNKFDIVRDILLKVFTRQFLQNGDWPQWGMFDKYIHIHAQDSHGDIILWPLHALASYLEASNDLSILEEKVPFIDMKTGVLSTEKATILEHVHKEIEAIKENFIPKTYLSCYGGGDWDDTLQPYNRDLIKRSVSGWTVALTIESLNMFASSIKDNLKKEAKQIMKLSSKILKDYNKYIICDGVPAGFVYFNNPIKYMLHPRDEDTKIKYRLLPFNQGISAQIFSKKQALSYLPIIDKYLKHPDGVRLMSDAVNYQGGKNTFFIRAETASNFGREIGLQYVHAHIRYVEAMAKLNLSHRVLDGLLVINPIKLSDHVKNALPRQSNMYFSSSDGYFYDRYEAKRDFDKLRDGSVKVKGGWRLYSSGPGLYLSLLITNLFGLKRIKNNLVIDPCLSKEYNNLQLSYKYDDKKLHITYIVNKDDGIASKINLNGNIITSKVKINAYKKGAIIIKNELLKAENEIIVYID